MYTEAANHDSTPLPLRNDTLLGVCEAIGRELGFNPTWLRIAFAALLFANPTAVIATYVALGIVVGLAHWLLPDRKAVAAPAVTAAASPPEAANEAAGEASLPVAA